MSERYEHLYGAPDGTWFFLSGPVGTPSPPYIANCVQLGDVADQVRLLWKHLAEQRRPRSRRKMPPAQQVIAEALGVPQQAVSRVASGLRVRWSDEVISTLVKLSLDPQPLLDRVRSDAS